MGGGNHPNHPELKAPEITHEAARDTTPLPARTSTATSTANTINIPGEPRGATTPNYQERTAKAIEREAESPPACKAKALVSKAGSAEVLVSEILLANKVVTAHLDSCATHCFVSSSMSRELKERGYPPTRGSITFEVTQGQPLCDSNLVHYVPLSIVREDGKISTWDSCMFIVADAGAPIIICNTVLRLGGIVKYDPPDGYVDMLRQQSLSNGATPLNSVPQLATNGAAPEAIYQAPSRTSSKCLLTALLEHPTGERSDSKLPASDENSEGHSNQTRENTNPAEGKNEPVMTQSLADPESSTSAAALATNAAKVTNPPPKKRRGETTMLSEEDPYGKNPPLPEEVMEAVRHLKLLADPATTPEYTPAQLEEVRERMMKDRPKWAQCLTLQKTIDVADKETELFIYDLMDKPRYQTSIFSSCMKKCCDLGEYEINQLPGRDQWTPSQPRRFKNPNTTMIVDAWLDALLDNEKCRESTASHPAPVTVVLKDARDPRV